MPRRPSSAGSAAAHRPPRPSLLITPKNVVPRRHHGALSYFRSITWYSELLKMGQRQPQACNLFAVIARLQEREGLHLEVQAVREATAAPREAV
jgi:hypothetical protein